MKIQEMEFTSSPPPYGAASLIRISAGIALLALGASAFASETISPIAGLSAVSTASQSSGPIKDQQGRVRYIVDLFEDSKDKPTKFNGAQGEVDWHKAKSAQQIDDVIKLRGVELVSTTSLVGTSFTAYLTDKQVEQFSKDKLVRRVTQDSLAQPSALWNSTTDASGQVRPWGLQAMGAVGGGSNGGATVYVVDTGVGLHADLPGLVAADQLIGEPGIPPVGCSPHGTHVAGIIGAADNGLGVVGVLPGVRLVSIAAAPNSPFVPPGVCLPGLLGSAFINSLEMIKVRGILSQKVGIVNVSYNGGNAFFSSTETVGEKMRNVAQPAGGYIVMYPGALIVQSAGNGFSNACEYAYNAPSAGDGILVVGGFDDNGQPVKQFSSGLGAYINVDGSLRGAEGGSNFGNCVEVWAPSQRILSTWPSGPSGGTHVLSGTSMAAPHVAGFAARILESESTITNSAQLEAAVRARFVTLNGSNLVVPHMSNQIQTARATVDIVDYSSGVTAINDVRTSSLDVINFAKFPEALGLRLEAVGATMCYSTRTQVGVYYPVLQSGPPPINLSAGLSTGQYSWNVTCYSPQGQPTTAVAQGRVKQHVVAEWVVNTTSTLGQFVSIPDGGQVTWSFDGAFDQISYGFGAQYCDVESYGFTGNPIKDRENPNFNPSTIATYGGETWLWSNLGTWPYLHLPPYTQFATFYFQNPQSSPYGLAPFSGYKWRLTCTGDEVKTKIMYGTMQ